MNDERQRDALRALLEEGEQRVPTIVPRIQEAIRREARAQGQYSAATTPVPPVARDRQDAGSWRARHPGESRRAIVWRNVAAVAIAAVIILAATALFSQRLLIPGGGAKQPHPQPTTTAHAGQPTSSPDLIHSPTTVPSAGAGTPTTLFGGWNASMIAFPDSGSGAFSIKNYDYTNGFAAALNTSPLPAGTRFDGISSDGQDLLYQYTSSNHVFYARLLTPFANTGYFYELNAGNAGNAIWMPDSRHVLIATQHMGVIEVDSVTGQETPYLPNLVTSRLISYHPGYLYYMGANQVVDRINVATDVVQPLTSGSTNPTIWISPDGTTLYWVNTGQAGQPGIYATNLTTLSTRFLRGSGEPVGFAADNSLLIVRLLNGQFQVVKLGATPQQDQVIFADAAPGAASLCATPHQICDNFVAMAPYGHAVIVQGVNADGRYHLWSDDLETGQQIELGGSSDNRAAAQLLGWDRLPLPG